MSGSVWVTVDRRRAFVVPADVAMPVGELELSGARGETRYADEAALSAYEVSLAEAERALEEQARVLYQRVRDAVGELLVVLRFAGALRLAESGGAPWGDTPMTGAAEDLLSQLRTRFEGAGQADPPDPDAQQSPGSDPREPRPEDLLGDAAREMGERLRKALSTPEVSGALSALGSRLQELASSLADPRPAPPARPPARDPYEADDEGEPR